MKLRSALYVFFIFFGVAHVFLMTPSSEGTAESLYDYKKTFVECALSRHVKKIDYLGIATSFCHKKCKAVPKPLFCDRKRFLQTYGSPRFDFSQLPKDDSLLSDVVPVDVVYSAVGRRFYGPGGQSYVFHSIRQWRIFHPLEESRIFLIVDDDRMKDPLLLAMKRNFGITLVPQTTTTTERVRRYREVFYIQGFMHPGGNRTTGNLQFNQLVMERFFLVAAVMRKFNLRHVIHLENDNMIYTNMKRIVQAVAQCGYGLASTAPRFSIFVPGVVYIRDAESLEHLLDFVNDLLGCGRPFGVAVARAVSKKKDPSTNDMTYWMNYYQLYGSRYVGLLPTWVHEKGENCIVERSTALGLPLYIFDGASFGQWYSFALLHNSSVPPMNVRLSVKTRYMDITPPPYLQWTLEDGNKIPTWKHFRLISLHVHAKNLEAFSSR